MKNEAPPTEPPTAFGRAILRAAEILGDQSALARACRVKPGTIWASIYLKQKCPPWLAVRIFDATAGKVSLKELLPDVYERVEKELSERGAA
jgi:DNA-binding transcriptional regulator YdaS (Cro superfamily)